jgi:hypothetical protein
MLTIILLAWGLGAAFMFGLWCGLNVAEADEFERVSIPMKASKREHEAEERGRIQ